MVLLPVVLTARKNDGTTFSYAHELPYGYSSFILVVIFWILGVILPTHLGLVILALFLDFAVVHHVTVWRDAMQPARDISHKVCPIRIVSTVQTKFSLLSPLLISWHVCVMSYSILAQIAFCDVQASNSVYFVANIRCSWFVWLANSSRVPEIPTRAYKSIFFGLMTPVGLVFDKKHEIWLLLFLYIYIYRLHNLISERCETTTIAINAQEASSRYVTQTLLRKTLGFCVTNFSWHVLLVIFLEFWY